MSVSYRRRARVRLKICEISEICWTKIIRVNPCESVVKKICEICEICVR